MARRALLALLVATAAFADVSGAFGLALYALLGAVPVLAFAGLAMLAELIDEEATPGKQLQALLWGIGLALVLAGASVRAPAVGDVALPPFAGPALFACLVVLALEAVVGAAGAAVERPRRRRGQPAAADGLREAA